MPPDVWAAFFCTRRVGASRQAHIPFGMGCLLTEPARDSYFAGTESSSRRAPFLATQKASAFAGALLLVFFTLCTSPATVVNASPGFSVTAGLKLLANRPSEIFSKSALGFD